MGNDFLIKLHPWNILREELNSHGVKKLQNFDLSSLKPIELKIWKLIALGFSGQQIEKFLGINGKKLWEYKQELFRKLGIKSHGGYQVALLTRLAVKLKLVPPGPPWDAPNKIPDDL